MPTKNIIFAEDIDLPLFLKDHGVNEVNEAFSDKSQSGLKYSCRHGEISFTVNEKDDKWLYYDPNIRKGGTIVEFVETYLDHKGRYPNNKMGALEYLRNYTSVDQSKQVIAGNLSPIDVLAYDRHRSTQLVRTVSENQFDSSINLVDFMLQHNGKVIAQDSTKAKVVMALDSPVTFTVQKKNAKWMFVDEKTQTSGNIGNLINEYPILSDEKMEGKNFIHYLKSWQKQQQQDNTLKNTVGKYNLAFLAVAMGMEKINSIQNGSDQVNYYFKDKNADRALPIEIIFNNRTGWSFNDAETGVEGKAVEFCYAYSATIKTPGDARELLEFMTEGKNKIPGLPLVHNLNEVKFFTSKNGWENITPIEKVFQYARVSAKVADITAIEAVSAMIERANPAKVRIGVNNPVNLSEMDTSVNEVTR